MASYQKDLSLGISKELLHRFQVVDPRLSSRFDKMIKKFSEGEDQQYREKLQRCDYGVPLQQRQELTPNSADK